MLKGLQKNSKAGFSLVELMISTALLVIIAGATIGAMNSSQKRYRQSEAERALHQQMRGALDQITQEISEAGLVPTGMEMISGVTAGAVTNGGFTTQIMTLTVAWSKAGTPPACSPNTSNQCITVSSTAGLFANENLWVDTGANAEAVTIGSINTSTNVITLNIAAPNTLGLSSPSGHAIGAPVYPRGIFPAGVLVPQTALGSTNSSLRLFGDINNDGVLNLVQYDCPQTGSNTTNSLVRSTWSFTSSTWVSNKTPVLDNVTSCQFSYTYTANLSGAADPTPTINNVIRAPDNPNGTASTTSQALRFTLTDGITLPQFVVSLGITLTTCSQSGISETQSLYDQSGTGANTICLSKSFLNIQPRNVLAGYLQAQQIYNNDAADTPPDTAYEYQLLNFQPLPPASLFPAGNP
jgi:prepilin-type N-terminal cleavage/methylation domain-containing protein